ncbi:hypothetical protein DUI87_02764 [Hirundo rustica rustica]|uniref:Uncharacterized protein n=1 Tax=Hirundo rustica rustica TaxID=333673 RepID=A0A3M0L9A6_HIRRU|nr:hypothetical protein DUI87_02764 [Hirundo rustica rustica]
MFWGFINNCTQFVRGGVGDEALQPLLSFFSFESVTSLLEKVQRLLNVKDPTSLVFHLVTFLYIVYSFSRMSHALLNTVGQQIEAREQGDKSVTQAAANPTAIQAAAKPDSEAKTPAVAAVKKGKKHMDKTDRPVDDDSGERSSMPPDTQSGVKPPDTQSEAEATDDTQSEAEPTDTKSEAKSTGTRSGVQPAATTSGAQPTAVRAGARPTAARAGDTIESFSLKDLRSLRKDYTRRPDESIISWLIRLWDAASEATILDSTEVRHLGSLSHDPVIDQEMMREASPCSLWEQHPSSSSMFWGFINYCTQFVRGGVGDEALQPLLSFFSFESVTSLLENVQGLLNVKDTTFLVFHLVSFLYMVYSFSRMSHALLNTVGQQIEAREQGDKSVTQAAANPTAIQAAAKSDSEAKTPAVAAIKKGKKHTDKTDRPVDDDSGEGSSMPPDTQSGAAPTDTQSEAKATDDTQSEVKPTDTKSEAKSIGTRSGVQPTSTRSEAQPTATRSGDTIESFSLKDLRGLRKDYT